MKKIKAGYYGFLVGDAMGVPLEFASREELVKRPVTTMLDNENYKLPAGSWSDDSSMLIATMSSIMAKKQVDCRDIMEKIVEWIDFGKYTSTGEAFDIGRTCLKAVERYKTGIPVIEAGMEGINFNGNGSLVRMIPIAFYAFMTKMTEDEIIDMVCDVSSLTHRHEISCLGCYILARYTMFLLEGFDAFASYEKIKKLDYSAFADESIKAYERLLFDNVIDYSLNNISSTGYVVDTLEAVIWCVCNTENFEQAVIGAINLGGDADTIGALTGALAGIIYGYDDIPKAWINKLQKRDYLKLVYVSFIKTLNNLD